jgi:hypothetical protein
MSPNAKMDLTKLTESIEEATKLETASLDQAERYRLLAACHKLKGNLLSPFEAVMEASVAVRQQTSQFLPSKLIFI